MIVVKLLRIHGRVQGIGYRYAMLVEATRIGLTGWVRNRMDGTVEAMVAGTKEEVERLIEWAKQGPRGAKVTRVDVEDAEGNFDSFEQIPSA